MAALCLSWPSAGPYTNRFLQFINAGSAGIADVVYRTHFHSIPEHPNLVGTGKCSFEVTEANKGLKHRPKGAQQSKPDAISTTEKTKA